MPKPHTAAWLKKHGFTNGLWRLEERSKTSMARAKERNMDKKLIETLFLTLDEIVRADGVWTAKRNEILSAASTDDKTNLGEILAWFEEDEEEDEEDEGDD
jgi:hypothetical protein